MSDGWWNDSESAGDYGQYDPAQTAEAQSQLDPNTTYAPPGTAAPIDQYNFVPDPNAPGGYQTYGPGQVAPIDLSAFSNQSGQYPDASSMTNAIANSVAGSYQNQQTIGADGSIGGMNWQDYYNQSMSSYSPMQQQMYPNVEAVQQGFGQLPQNEQDIWYGTYGGNAPAIWAQQSAANMMGGMAGGGEQYPFMGNYPQWFGGGTVAPSTWNPVVPSQGRNEGWGTIGAGTSGIQYGYGVPGFGQAPIQIDPSYLAVMQNQQLLQQLMPGYIPGSGTYNQFNLSQPGMIQNLMGQPTNMRYGLGGTGDPTTGLETQTPEQWVQGGPLFEWGLHSQGKLPRDVGYDHLTTLFMRSDTPSGINTAAWSAPQQFWDSLAESIAKGYTKPTARGWQLLNERGYSPQKIGGAAPQQAASVGAGGAGGTGTGPMGAGTQAFNYQAAYLDYLTARMNMLELPQMQNQNQWQIDRLAFDQAKQKWLEQYQQQVFGEGQRQFNELQGLRQGELVGQYNGQQTLASRAEQNQTALGYLNLLSRLRGPGDIFQYLKVLNGTPGGIRDIVNAASGAYRMPTTGGVTVGGYSGGSDLNTLLGQINDPNYGAEGQNLNLPLPNQINALALQRMTPSQQQSLLAAYEAAGYNPQDVLAIFRNSLPQYAGGGGAGRVNLFAR